jgi:APA family basic amino acid/polyamine antiporter
VTRVLLVASLVALTAVVVAGWSSDAASIDRITPIDGDLYGIVQSAGFLFFAFAGYARIATLLLWGAVVGRAGRPCRIRPAS